jgi:hypothetical protein
MTDAPKSDVAAVPTEAERYQARTGWPVIRDPSLAVGDRVRNDATRAIYRVARVKDGLAYLEPTVNGNRATRRAMRAKGGAQ